MKRIDLAARLQPVVDKFAKALLAIVESRIDDIILRAEGAIEGALSVVELEPVELAAPTKARTPKPKKLAKPPRKVKAQITCKKCGFVGGNSRGCGTAHETVSSIATGESPPPTTAKPDRFARIEAMATKRNGATYR